MEILNMKERNWDKKSSVSQIHQDYGRELLNFHAPLPESKRIHILRKMRSRAAYFRELDCYTHSEARLLSTAALSRDRYARKCAEYEVL